MNNSLRSTAASPPPPSVLNLHTHTHLPSRSVNSLMTSAEPAAKLLKERSTLRQWPDGGRGRVRSSEGKEEGEEGRHCLTGPDGGRGEWLREREAGRLAGGRKRQQAVLPVRA